MLKCCWQRWTRSGSAGRWGCCQLLKGAPSLYMMLESGARALSTRLVADARTSLFVVQCRLDHAPNRRPGAHPPHTIWSTFLPTACSEELVRTLEAAEREAVAATEQLLKAQAKIEQLKAKAKGKGGKDRGGQSGLPASPSLASLEGGEAVEALQARIAALKASRDKLIGAFDAQAAEIERLSGDNAALAEVGGWADRLGEGVLGIQPWDRTQGQGCLAR